MPFSQSLWKTAVNYENALGFQLLNHAGTFGNCNTKVFESREMRGKASAGDFFQRLDREVSVYGIFTKTFDSTKTASMLVQWPSATPGQGGAEWPHGRWQWSPGYSRFGPWWPWASIPTSGETQSRRQRGARAVCCTPGRSAVLLQDKIRCKSWVFHLFFGVLWALSN